MTYRIKLLGSLQIEENGHSLRLMDSNKGCALVAYLILAGGVQSREVVADMLWEASSTRQALQSLRNLLVRVRRWLPGVEVTRQTVAFQPTADTFVDYLALQEGLKTADLTQLDAALQLYNGDLLTSFHPDGMFRFNEWLATERERLRTQVWAAQQRLCAAYAEQAAWEKGIATARRWLTVDPLDEAPHRWLMQMLADSGQSTAAWQAYESCRQILQAELGVKPEAATQQLAQQVQAQLESELLVTSTAVSPPKLLDYLTAAELAEPGLLPSNAILPLQRNQDFVGRTAELLRVANLLDRGVANGRIPVVALTGMAGVGKTQTAVEFCYRYGRFFTGGVYWLNFGSGDSVAEEVAAVGSERGLGLFSEGEKLTLADRVGRVQRAWQAATPRLLVFDNCESEELLKTWLPVSGGCHILLTSRRGAWAHELSVMPLSLAVLSVAESVALLQRLVTRLTAAEAAQIAEAVGYLPLALHLAGGFLNRYRQISPTAYVAQLRDENLLHHPSLQGHGLRHSPTDHRLNIARTFAVSLEQLDLETAVDRRARQLLAHAICFAPGEPLAKALLQATLLTAEPPLTAVLEVEDGLARLVALGLLRVEEDEQMVMHRLVNAFAQSVLKEEAATKAVESVVDGMLTAVWEASLDLGQLPLPTSQLRHLTDNALLRDHDLLAANLANHLGRHFLDSGQLDKAEAYLEQAVDIRQFRLGQHPTTASSLTNLATLFFRVGSYDEAQRLYEQAVVICKKHFGSTHFRTASSLNNLAIVHSRRGNYREAQRYYEKTLGIYQQAAKTDDPMFPIILTNLGINYRRLGQYEQARNAYQQALAWREAKLGRDHLATLMTLHSLGYLEFCAGNYGQAESHFQYVLAVREKVLGKASHATLWVRLSLARLDSLRQQCAAAKTALESLLTSFQQRFGSGHNNVGVTLTYLGYVCHQLGERDQAVTHLTHAMQIQEAIGEQREEMVEVLLFLADFYLTEKELTAAKATLDRALAICAAIFDEQHPIVGRIWLRWGEWQQGQGESGDNYFQQAQAVLQTAVSPTHVDFVRLQTHLAA